jgi:hypothetical protein
MGSVLIEAVEVVVQDPLDHLGQTEMGAVEMDYYMPVF